MATWLRTGTAALTNGNTTVTLTGADMIAAQIRIGDAFHGPDGKVYEIAAINSATVLVLETAYLGSTASGQPYAIQPTRGIVKSLYNSVQTLVSTVTAQADGVLSGLFPAGTSGAPSIAKAGDTNTGIHWPAENTLALATDGTTRVTVNTVRFDLALPIYVPNGTATAPAMTFAQNPNTGFYRAGSNVIGVAAGGVTAATFDSTGVGLANNKKLTLGTGDDAELFFDGTATIIATSAPFKLTSGAGETLMESTPNGAAALYHNNVKTLETTATGANVTGELVADAVLAGVIDSPEVLKTLTGTATDVFVYDTSKDSDGGAWRHRCQHTSWYNEPLGTGTRGTRREFPAVAVIVAEASKVTIYDGDDPALPMWMVFNQGGAYPTMPLLGRAVPTITSVAMQNAVFVAGVSNFGYAETLFRIEFVSEQGRMYSTNSSNCLQMTSSIAQRNSNNNWVLSPGETIVQPHVNDVAMTVLPTAQVDPATGLPVPTIAVATDGGVSVIKDDGTVVDIVHSDNAVTKHIDLRDDLVIYNASTFIHARKIPTSDIAAGVRYSKNAEDVWFAARNPNTIYASPTIHLDSTASAASNAELVYDGNRLSLATSKHLANGIMPEASTGMDALSNFISAHYNTGWMAGDIKGAWLADTDATSLVGGTAADRSPSNTPLNVNGTITRTPVATGAELVAYSGFSDSNYLEQPYNADLDFGTGDFCVMGWARFGGFGATQRFFYRGNSEETDGRILIGCAEQRWECFVGQNYGTAAISTVLPVIDKWTHVAAARRNGVLYLYIDGVLNASIPALVNTSNATAFTRVGLRTATTPQPWEGSIALLRISATAPTDEQIAKIYRDEQPLFRENAACTLYGADSFVRAIARDPDTGLLHVGTSAGRSVFKGLERIDNTTTPVTTAISASGGLVVEE